MPRTQRFGFTCRGDREERNQVLCVSFFTLRPLRLERSGRFKSENWTAKNAKGRKEIT